MIKSMESYLTQHYWLFAEAPRLAGQFLKTGLELSKFNNLPLGSNRPTVVVPGFATSNVSTLFMRGVLDRNNHNTFKWALQRNLGFSEYVIENTVNQVRHVANVYGMPVNLIGQSLGGCYVRAVANQIPDYVNCVVTLGSPINSITQVNENAIKKYNTLTGMIDAAFVQHTYYYHTFYPNPPVPTTSIYSRSDGVVHFSQSLINVTDLSENIEVEAGHFSMGFDLDTLIVIADRLSRDKENWEKWPKTTT